MKNKGSFVVIEGPDGSGKSTQLGLLRRYLRSSSIAHRYLHFPRYSRKPFGELITMYLNGAFGELHQVSPYLASLLFAGDRKDADKDIREWINRGLIVIADRYFLSNLAYQRAKIKDPEQRQRFSEWLSYLEFRYNKIVKPSLYVYLDVPKWFVIKNLNSKRTGSDKGYLKDSEGKDIHERDRLFQERVIEEYQFLAKASKDIVVLKCYGVDGEILAPKEINNRIVSLLKTKGILQECKKRHSL